MARSIEAHNGGRESMPQLSMTVGGLVALLYEVRNNREQALAVLVKNDKHQHMPLLIVPSHAIEHEGDLVRERRDDLFRKALPGVDLPDLSDYRGYKIAGCSLHVSVDQEELGVLQTERTALQGPCPNGNWDSLNWLLELNEPGQTLNVDLQTLLTHPSVQCTVPIESGRLSGRMPVEQRRFGVRKALYGERPARAYSDAFLWETSQTDSARITIRTVDREGDLVLRAPAEIFVLNLPVPTTHAGHFFGDHISAFGDLPTDPRIQVRAVSKDAPCPGDVGTFGTFGGPTTPDHSAESGNSSDEVEVAVKVKRAGGVPVTVTVNVGPSGRLAAPHPHGGEASGDAIGQPSAEPFLVPLGDNNCMGGIARVRGIWRG